MVRHRTGREASWAGRTSATGLRVCDCEALAGRILRVAVWLSGSLRLAPRAARRRLVLGVGVAAEGVCAATRTGVSVILCAHTECLDTKKCYQQSGGSGAAAGRAPERRLYTRVSTQLSPLRVIQARRRRRGAHHASQAPARKVRATLVAAAALRTCKSLSPPAVWSLLWG